jgi:hypothetical protein
MREDVKLKLTVEKHSARFCIRTGIFFIRPSELLIFMRACEDFCSQDSERGNHYTTRYSISAPKNPDLLTPVPVVIVKGYNDK